MQAGDWGITLVFVPRVGSGLQDFTGANSANLVVTPPGGGARKSFPLTFSGDRKTASYTTVQGDFPVDGAYSWNLEVSYPTQFIQTPLQTMAVGEVPVSD
jgi:hypothetical protein